MAERKRIKKSTASAKRKVKKPEPQKKNTSKSREVGSIILIALGILIVASYYFEACGPVGAFLLDAGLGIFGSSAYALPVLFIVFGAHMALHRKERKVYAHCYISAAIIYICICALWHLCDYDYFEEGFSLADAYSFGTLGVGGGAFGSLICVPLKAALAKVGTVVVLVSTILIAFVVMTDFSITKGLALLYRKSKAYYEKSIEEWEDEEEQEIPPKGKKKGYDVFKDIDEKPNKKNKKEDEEGPAPWDEIEDDFYNGAEPVINLYSGREEEKKTEDAPVPMAEAPVPEDNTPIPVEIEEQEEKIPYTYPPLELFSKIETGDDGEDKPENLRQTAKKLVETLASFGVEAKVLEVSRGPSITRFELQPKAGVKVSKITGLADDIALNLAASGVRIEAPIPGKAAVGIEIPNQSVSTVPLHDVIGTDAFEKFPSKLAFALGKDISGAPVIADISKMPHLLIAGATGSGKSVCINALVTSILYKASPNEVKLLMVDPKVVELGVYNGIPHLLIPVVTDARKAAGALNWAVQEMTERYKLFAEHNVRNLQGYNALAREKGWREKEQIVIIIDELADLMMVAPRDVEDAICRLAQLARAAGMHLVIATQRPSVDVITGIIKANIPSRIAFAVSSQVDSRTILDGGGAEKLLGRGDMLFMPVGAAKPTRIQGAFIPDGDVEKIVEFVKGDREVDYDEDILEKIENCDTVSNKEEEAGDNDELLPKAIEVVVEAGQASVSLVQRRLKVGYSRAGRLIDQMEARGIIGPHEGSKPRSILISKQEFYEMSSNYEESES